MNKRIKQLRKTLGLNQKQLESLATASLLHNIGKSAKDPLIANKVKLNVPIYNEELYPIRKCSNLCR